MNFARLIPRALLLIVIVGAAVVSVPSGTLGAQL